MQREIEFIMQGVFSVTDDIKDYKFAATDLAGYEVYGNLSGDGKHLERPGVTIKFKTGSLKPNEHYTGNDFVPKFYRGVATGECEYSKGKVYTGYLEFNLVHGCYAIGFKDEHGWNSVPVHFESIEPINENQLELNFA